MKNKTLDDIKSYAVQKLTAEYGYCGLAQSENFALLNSGSENETLLIRIDDKKDN